MIVNLIHRKIAEAAEGLHHLFNQLFDWFDTFKARIARYLSIRPMVKLLLVYFILWLIIVTF